MNKNKWFLNGGRGSGRTYRMLFEYYENKVAELEKENAELKIDLNNHLQADNYIDSKMCDELETLRKENAELKCECRRCVYTDSPCVLSDYGKDKNGMCDHFKDVFEELQDWKKEWHFVKDEGTPKAEGHYLVCLRNKNKDIFDCWIYYDKDIGWYSMKVRMKDIYAWKEIVLPKESDK